jgi:hypothetical protein
VESSRGVLEILPDRGEMAMKMVIKFEGNKVEVPN